MRNYIKAFFEFNTREKDPPELKDSVAKIITRFDNYFQARNHGMIEQFIQHLLGGFELSTHKIYLIRILNLVLQHHMPGDDKLACNPHEEKRK